MADRDDTFDNQLKKFRKELSAGTVALVLMAVLERAREPLYGYQIAKQLEAADGAMVAGKQSALYPVLRNLSAAGLLESWVEPSVSGPPRRYYRITPDGRAVFGAWKSAWNKTCDFVNSLLEHDDE
ncbi:MAG TPA: PadR family transcriptional regulator [Gammaproteobacteria bacterium]